MRSFFWRTIFLNAYENQIKFVHLKKRLQWQLLGIVLSHYKKKYVRSCFFFFRIEEMNHSRVLSTLIVLSILALGMGQGQFFISFFLFLFFFIFSLYMFSFSTTTKEGLQLTLQQQTVIKLEIEI